MVFRGVPRQWNYLRREKHLFYIYHFKGDMNFALRRASRTSNGLTLMMQDVCLTAPEAVDMWPLIGADCG